MSERLSNDRLGILAAILSSATGGVTTAVTRFAMAGTDPITLAALRFGLGFVCLLPVTLALRSRWSQRRDLMGIVLLGILFFAIFQTLFNLSLRYTTAARGALARCDPADRRAAQGKCASWRGWRRCGDLDRVGGALGPGLAHHLQALSRQNRCDECRGSKRGSRLRRQPMSAMRICVVPVAVVLLACAANASDAERTAQMISELGLIEAPRPVRESRGWRKPERIVVGDVTAARLAWLREVAPGVELVPAASSGEAAALAKHADAVLGYCTSEIIDAGKHIRWIQWYFADVESCVAVPGIRSRGVLLTNMQKVAGPVMAEHVIAMTLAFARGLHTYVQAQTRGEWNPALVGSERAFTLQGKTMFVAGLGGVGTEVARRAHGLGMRVIATRASTRPAPAFVSRIGVADDMLAMVREADVVVNTLPLTAETRGVFNARVFSEMKASAYFINVGRGASVVTADLVKALENGTIAGAGLDVTDPEPLPADHPLWAVPDVIITPHVSSDADVDSENRWLLLRENLRRYVAGERMLSVVDVARGY